VVEQEAAILKDRGHDVETIIFDNTSIKGFFSKLKISLQSVYNFSSARKVSKLIREFKPDIIHVHNLFFIASPSVIYAAKKYKVPVVLTVHNYRLICANALLLRDNKVCELCINKKFPIAGIRYRCYRNSAAASALVTLITGFHKFFNTWKNKVDRYITLNEFSRSKLLHSSLQVSSQKMITKTNFIPEAAAAGTVREDFFLFAGRIVVEKGVYVLANAFAQMPNEKLVIIGEGPEKSLLQEQYKGYSNISYTGALDKHQVRDYMCRCKALICPSIWYEGAPLTIIEAFATGTPVIASRLGAMSESITDGFNGLHFTAGDVNDLKDKISLFIREAAGTRMFYKNARQTYLDKYTVDIHYRSILKIYENLVAGKK
jgi:glycosyltransferase involved in cell wall biosynthesis